jgi:hypothetical protein
VKYPDGRPIKIGDRVWWNEGNGVGRVVGIHETERECDQQGVKETGINVGVDGTTGGSYVSYSLSALADDGIGLLTQKEEAEIDHIIEQARKFSASLESDTAASVFRNRKKEPGSWFVVLYRNGQALRVFDINPADHSCLEISLKASGLFYDLND